MAENKQRIQGVLAAMGWNESDFSLEPQALGSTNTSYLCTYRGERYVLRLGSEHPGLLAINRKAEEAALRVVSAIGCGAELVYYDGATGNMLTRYIEGREMTGKDFHDPQLLLQGIRQMQNLHRQKTDYRFDMYQDIERKLAAIRENGIPLHPDFEKAYACYCERRDRHPLETSPHIGLCHGDPFANNFVLDTAGKVHLLDYEYAGISDVFYDLACFSSGWAKPDREKLLELYFGACTPDLLQKLYDFAVICILWNGTWAYLKSCDVSPDVFDYVDYGHQHVEALLRFCRENDLT